MLYRLLAITLCIVFVPVSSLASDEKLVYFKFNKGAFEQDCKVDIDQAIDFSVYRLSQKLYTIRRINKEEHELAIRNNKYVLVIDVKSIAILVNDELSG